MVVENLMFSLIRSEICDCVAEESVKEALTADVLNELYNLSKKHDLSHIVAAALSKIGALKDDEISACFNRQLMRSLHRDVQREYALALAGSVLENQNIPHIFMKGSVLCHLYPQTWMRTSCDIDILIHKEDTDLAEKALCEAGFLRIGDHSTHDYNYLSPNKVHVEIHYTLTQDGKMSSCDPLLESVWDTYAGQAAGLDWRYEMPPELIVIYHLAHMGRHLLHGGCGIRPFIDLWLISKKSSVDPIKLNVLLAQCDLTKLYHVSSDLSKVWFEGCQHNKETELLEMYVLSGGTYGSVTNAAKVKAAKGVGKVRALINIIFLPRENLQVLYPRLKKYPILFPFYQVVRWFGIFNADRREKVKRMASARNSVSQDAENTTKDLLKSLGLLE